MGFYAHSDPALSDLPTFLYLLLGDSPAAPVLMTLSAVTLLSNLDRRVASAPVNRLLAYLHTLAFVWLVKYGVWTVVALNLRPDLYVGFSGVALWDYQGIMFIHAGFLAFMFVVSRYGATTEGVLGFALTLAFANDMFDRSLGYYPPLKCEAEALLAGIIVALPFLAVFLASRVLNRLPNTTETAREHPVGHNR